MKLLLLTLPSLLLLTSCANLFMKERTYQTEGGAQVNGAQVTSAVKPMGGSAGLSVSAMVYSAVAGSTDGPFLWRIEALGEEGIHQSMTVHQLTVKTNKTKRSEPFPARWLGEAVPFELMKGKENQGKVFAKFQMPGKLEAYPEKDGKITVEAEVSITTTAGTEKQKLAFQMNPQIGRKIETVFLPKEIVKSFGRKDPTEWKWQAWSGDSF